MLFPAAGRPFAFHAVHEPGFLPEIFDPRALSGLYDSTFEEQSSSLSILLDLSRERFYYGR